MAQLGLMSVSEVMRRWGALGRGEEDATAVITVEGRLVSAYQEAARLAFWMLSDGAAELEALLTPSMLGYEDAFQAAVAAGPGDYVRVVGPVGRTRRGVLAVKARSALVLSTRQRLAELQRALRALTGLAEDLEPLGKAAAERLGPGDADAPLQQTLDWVERDAGLVVRRAQELRAVVGGRAG
jgi:hypothetical protein